MKSKNCLQCGAIVLIKTKRDVLRKKYCSYACRQKFRWKNEPSYKEMFFERARPASLTPESNNKKRNFLEKNGSYKKDRSLVKGRLRPESNLFKKIVFARDNFRCVWCGVSGVRLIVDHIKPYAIYKELRYNPENGRTLCEPCHRKTDTYGSKTIKLKNRRNKCHFVQKARGANSTS